MNNYYLGCDVSKGYCDFIFMNQQKEVVEKNFQLDDNRNGHERLLKLMNNFVAKHNPGRIYVALESTGGYENNWIKTFRKIKETLPIEVTRVNPAGVCFSSKAELNRNVTDKTSAKTIAEYQINHSEKINYNQSEDMFSLKKYWKTLSMMKKQKAQLLNQLHSVLYNSNPEILIYCRNAVPGWVMKLIERYPTAKNLSTATVKNLRKIPHIDEKKAETLILRAKTSVASLNDEVTEALVKQLMYRIYELENIIEEQEKYLENKYKSEVGVELLTSFKGIGVYSAIGLLIRVDGVERFSSVKHISSYFGVHPVYKLSGDGKWGIKMSKKGNAEVRYLLYNIARTAVVHNPIIKEFYKSLRQRGMPKMAALGAVMHKVLRIVYGMLKNNQKFNPEYRKKDNQSVENKKVKPDLSRRYQKLSSEAPISRRQNKKRKEQLIFQSRLHREITE